MICQSIKKGFKQVFPNEEQQKNELMYQISLSLRFNELKRMEVMLLSVYRFLSNFESDITKDDDLVLISKYYYIVERIPNIVKQIDTVREKLKTEKYETHDLDLARSEWTQLHRELPELLELLNDQWFVY